MTESRPNPRGVDREATGLGVATGLMLLAALWLWLAPARGASIAAREGAPVRTVRAVARDMPRYVDTVGTVQAFNTVVVRSRVDGEIGRIAFREGRIVRKGDVLQRPIAHADSQCRRDVC